MDVLVKPVTAFLGALLILVGALSFFASGSLMLISFHVFTGLMAIYAFGSSQLLSHRYLVFAGLIFALVTVLGFFGFLPVTTFDTYLHLVISIASLIVGFGSGK